MNIDAGTAFIILWMIVMVVSFTWLAILKHNSDKKLIREYLLDKGYRNIEIHYEWFDFDKSNSTYQVMCRNPEGVRIMTSCKVDRWSEDIYWKSEL